MKYYARCNDRRGVEVLLTCKTDTPEAAVAYLKERYGVKKVTFLSTQPIVERDPWSYYGTSAACLKSSAKHAGRVRGRGLREG